MSALSSIVQRATRSSSPSKLAVLAAVAGLVASFAACHVLGEDSDSANQPATSQLPDWSNDMTKIHRK